VVINTGGGAQLRLSKAFEFAMLADVHHRAAKARGRVGEPKCRPWLRFQV
jgi:hypothetical protein